MSESTRADGEDRRGRSDATRATGRGAAGAGGPPPRRPGGGAGLHIYKPGQGMHLRWGTAAGAGVLLVGFVAFLHEQLTWFSQWVQYLIPVGLLVGLGYGLYRLLGQSRSAVDFMIATEGEMKKVNWSTRREVLGATRVVIATVIALGAILFVVNIFFIFVFESIGVLRIGMLKQLFGGGAE